ncbi:hypothetical protein, partial [Pseudomonas sp. FEN]
WRSRWSRPCWTSTGPTSRSRANEATLWLGERESGATYRYTRLARLSTVAGFSTRRWPRRCFSTPRSRIRPL